MNQAYKVLSMPRRTKKSSLSTLHKGFTHRIINNGKGELSGMSKNTRKRKSKGFDNLLLHYNKRYGWAGDVSSFEETILFLQESGQVTLDECMRSKEVSMLIWVEGDEKHELMEIPVPSAIIKVLVSLGRDFVGESTTQ